jgi:lysophospholipase L1-like esterase
VADKRADNDSSWTIAPALLWFCGALIGGLFVFDGGVQAIADRVTTKREDTPAPGTTFAKPVTIADVSAKEAEPPTAPPPVADTGDRAHVASLEDVCLEGTPDKCKRWGMDGFYRALTESKQKKLDRPVRVSWYGDSVIATDTIPARLRSRLQGELGDGGPGFIYIVPPHRFCAHERVVRTNAGDWKTHAISTLPVADGLYGVGGASAETYSGNATIKLLAGTATNVELYYVAQPKGGTATIKADGKDVLEAATAAETKAGSHALGTTPAAKKFELTTKGKVRLYGIDISNSTGAVVDNFGIVSVHAKNFGARNAEDFTAELAHRKADLMIVQIGANEAQWLSTSARAMADYQAQFEKALAPLRKARPDGTCLVVSPLDQAEAKDDGYVSKPVIAAIVEAQRKAAKASGCAFYATFDWMGGKGSAAKWFKKGMIGSDFVHPSRKGANKMTDALYEALMAGYQRYAK